MYWLLYTVLFVLLEAQELNHTRKTENARVVKGKQYVEINTVARVVGGSVPEDILRLIQNETTSDMPLSPELPLDENHLPQLIVDNIKTTSTRMAIPLSSKYMESEWYATTLRKFLKNNKINLSRPHALQHPSNKSPQLPVVALKLVNAINFRNNLLILFRNILFKNSERIAENYHAALFRIYELLQLRKIPVIDMLSCYRKLTKQSTRLNLQIIFSYLEALVPKYIRSCVTFWLEGLQDDKELPNHAFDKQDKHFFDFTEVPLIIPHEELLFPREILSKVQFQHDQEIGNILKALMQAIGFGILPLSPQMIALLYLNLPQNEVNIHADLTAINMVQEKNYSFQEIAIVSNIAKEIDVNSFTSSNSYFREILRSILLSDHFNCENYEVLLRALPYEPFRPRQFHIMKSFNDPQSWDFNDLLDIIPKEYILDNLKEKATIINAIQQYLIANPDKRVFISSATPEDLLEAILSIIRDSKILPNETKNNIDLILLYVHTAKTVQNREHVNDSEIIALLSLIVTPKEAAERSKRLQKFLREGCMKGLVPIRILCLNPVKCIVPILKYALDHNCLTTASCLSSAEELLEVISK